MFTTQFNIKSAQMYVIRLQNKNNNKDVGKQVRYINNKKFDTSQVEIWMHKLILSLILTRSEQINFKKY